MKDEKKNIYKYSILLRDLSVLLRNPPFLSGKAKIPRFYLERKASPGRGGVERSETEGSF